MEQEKFAWSVEVVLGFILPGLAAIYGLSLLVPSVAAWLADVAQRDTTVGGFMLLMVASFGTGVAVAGVRSACARLLRLPPPPPFDITRRTDPNVDAIYRDTRACHWPYFLFYGNLMVVVFVEGLAYLILFWPGWQIGLVGVLIGAVVLSVLYHSAHTALERYRAKLEGLVGFTGEVGHAERRLEPGTRRQGGTAIAAATRTDAATRSGPAPGANAATESGTETEPPAGASR